MTANPHAIRDGEMLPCVDGPLFVLRRVGEERNVSEKAIKVAAKLYEMRDFARLVLGDRYRGEVGTAQVVLTAIIAKERIDLMQAALRMMTDAKDMGPIVQAAIVAAVVDTTEGIDNTGRPTREVPA